MDREKKILIKNVEIYQEDKEHVLIGNTILNQYIRLHTSNKDCIEKLLLQYDGKNDRQDIEKYCSTNNISINLDILERQLQVRGFFQTEKLEKVNEIENLGIKIFLRIIDQEPNKRIQNICKGVSYFGYFLFCICSVYLLLHFRIITSFFNEELLKYRNSYSLGIITTIVCSYIILFMHEIAHVILGYAEGLTLHKVGFYMYMGVIPQWFVSFRGIWKAKKKSRLKIYSAGIVLNFLVVLICCIASEYSTHTDLLQSIGIGSLFMGINSLFPFNLTDGYFLFSMLLSQENLRQDMIVEMYNFVHFKFNKKKRVLYFYSLVNILFYGMKLWFCYYWLFRFLLEYTRYAIVLVIVCIFIHLTIVYNKCLELSKKYRGFCN